MSKEQHRVQSESSFASSKLQSMNEKVQPPGATRDTSGFMEKTRMSSGPPRVKSFFKEARPGADGEAEGTLTASGAVFGIISTILGGGIVGLPFSFYSCGLYLGLVIAIIASFQVVIQSILYLKAREVCPNKPSSFFEIGYLTLGRASIFIICFCIWVNSFFLIIIFLNVFSNIALNVMKSLIWDNCQDNYGTWRGSYAIGIAACLLPSIFMKEIAELHLVSVALFCAAIIFVVITVL